MQPDVVPTTVRSLSSRFSSAKVVDASIVLIFIIFPNLLLFISIIMGASSHQGAWFTIPQLLVWLLANAGALALLVLLRTYLLQPLRYMTQHMQHLRTTYHEDAPPASRRPIGLLGMAREMKQFVAFALEHYHAHQETRQELEHARAIIAQFSMQQKAILQSTNREIGDQYRNVLSYANYLDEQILRNKLDASIRLDFDDICESSFNLKLIAGALSMIGAPETLTLTAVPLAPLLQQTMLALSPSLDRRNMKLTTAEVDLSVTAQGDANTLAQILWMMLLGVIRYAADESTLRIRCLHSRDGAEALLSIVVSELSPSQLSEEERNAYLLRQLQHLTPHMFAETIRIHGNVQLAEMLVSHIGGRISIEPLTVSACEVCMVLPSAVIIKTCA